MIKISRTFVLEFRVKIAPYYTFGERWQNGEHAGRRCGGGEIAGATFRRGGGRKDFAGIFVFNFASGPRITRDYGVPGDAAGK